jgi:hypothetical protein
MKRQLSKIVVIVPRLRGLNSVSERDFFRTQTEKKSVPNDRKHQSFGVFLWR